MIDRRKFLASAVALGAASSGRVLASGNEVRGDLPLAGDFDLVVAGGSATGVCAAVTASRAGLRVAIVEYNAMFGGTATAALVPVWHSLFATDGKTKIIGGLTEEIERRLVARHAARVLDGYNPGVGCYLNVAELQIVLDELVRESKVTPFLKCPVVDAVLDRPGHLTGVVIEGKSGRRLLKAKYFIDATGDADLADRAGFATWKFPKTEIQAHTLCAIFDHVGDVSKRHPGFSIGELLKPRHGGGFKHVFQWTAPVVGSPNLTFVAATRVSSCDPSLSDDLSQGLMEARRQVRKLLEVANRDYPMPEDQRLSLVALGSDLGVRESRHIRAQYKVTTDDVLTGRHFADTIAKGSYRVDIHEGAGIIFRYLNGKEERIGVTPAGEISYAESRWRKDGGPYPTWYEIPFRALVPVGSDNLFCAGRMLDCERDAYGALRVMVNCNQMGEAAGRAVIERVKKGT